MIDFTTELTDLDGAILRDPLAPAAPLTLGRAAANALVSAVPGEQTTAGADHVARLALALKVKDAKAAVLTVEDAALIKDRIAKFYTNSLVVGRAWSLLDPPAAKD